MSENRGRKNKISNSVHRKFILDCIEKDMSAIEIQSLLEKRGMKISLPTLRNFICKIKKDGVNITQFRDKLNSTALAINEKLKDVPELSSVLNRRNFLLDTLLDRRKKIIEFADEGDRVAILTQLLDKVNDLIYAGDYEQAKANLISAKNYIRLNFKQYAPYPKIETLIKDYTLSIHEICKYVEQWTSQYEIEQLLEKLCKDITKVTIETFGPLIKKETPEFREKCINRFIQSVDNLMNDLKQNQLIIGDKHE